MSLAFAKSGSSPLAQAPSDELNGWLRLQQTAGVGLETARKLLAAFGLPHEIFAASHAAICEVVPERVANALCTAPPDTLHSRIERTHQWLAEEGNHVLTLADSAYPAALLQIPDPPLVLYVKGRLELLACPSVAIVGSRNATAQGVAHAQQFAHALSDAGLTVISGLALGIDTAAHVGALDGCGSTIAVIGTGADIVYPSRNRSLAHRLAETGAIVSEYPLGMPAIAANFPRRNRIISGLARGVLVVEAALKSGSLITARMAAEQGRDVFAIPGSIHSPLARGCHSLIKQGAKLVETAQDILDELSAFGSWHPTAALQPEAGDSAMPAVDEDQRVLLEALGFDPVDGETLLARCSLDAASLNAQLFSLELAGLVEVLPGGRYRRMNY